MIKYHLTNLLIGVPQDGVAFFLQFPVIIETKAAEALG